MKGGVGKTTVTLGLASAAANAGESALVVDLDPQGNASMGCAVEQAPFTSGDVRADARPGVAAQAIVPSGWGPAVGVIVADRALEHRNLREGDHSELRLRTSLATLDRQWSIIVIDCPPSLGELTRNALMAADAVVVVTEPGYFALRGAQQAVDAVSVIRSGGNPLLREPLIVVNRARTTVADHRSRISELRAAYPHLVWGTEIPERNAVAQSEGAGIPIHQWDSPAGRELAGIFDALLTDLRYPFGQAHRQRPIPRFT